MHSANDNPLNETVAPQKTPTTSFRAKIIRMILSLLAIYLTICGMMVILENRIVYPAPGSIDLALNDPTIEEVWIDSVDGTRLHGLFFPHPHAKRSLLYMHGNGEDVSRNVFYMNALREELQANILIFDYRGYGKSAGSPHEAGLIKDGLAAQTWLADRAEVATADIVIWGRSLGGGAAVAVAEKQGAQALILQNTFHDLRAVAADKFPWLPVRWLMRNRYPSRERIQNCVCPVLQTHGTRDRVVPFAMGKMLFDAIPHERKEFITVEGGGHNDPTSQDFLKRVSRDFFRR